jgi:DNA-binding MarR family transcriptional regulator
MDWENYGFVIASKIRRSIIVSLKKRPMMPSELADELGIDKSQITRVLKELQNKGLIYCLTPKHRKGRIYSLTENGTKIIKKL